jgi:cellulose synthase/poly-beta-1,6-N-acetylglucosamine synthase-like glycosyltransferase
MVPRKGDRQVNPIPLERPGGEGVTLVIAARDAAATLEACLRAVVRLLGSDQQKTHPPEGAPPSHPVDESRGPPDDALSWRSADPGAGLLAEIILVDDGSTDGTADIAGRYPVRILTGRGQGAAGARNLGWQAAVTPLIWFVDADCVAEPGALELLLPHLTAPDVAAAGGSYTNMQRDSLLATLIHEEIVARHRWMPVDVSVLASYHVLYRRQILEEVGGFDASCRWAHDAELAYRVRKAGYRLRFEIDSQVGHFHPVELRGYLAKQRQQGFWRVMLYRRHPERMAGDSYSGPWDFVQPPLAMLILATLPLVAIAAFGWLSVPLVVALIAALLLAQLPMTLRIVRQTGKWRHASFAALGFVRAFWRGAGMLMGMVDFWSGSRRSTTS